jgi:hypothetical protein
VSASEGMGRVGTVDSRQTTNRQSQEGDRVPLGEWRKKVSMWTPHASSPRHFTSPTLDFLCAIMTLVVYHIRWP